MFCIFVLVALLLVPWIPCVSAETEEIHYFENTDHELTVYFINGNEPGNTMMIIGGIQGDEQGGYLAADLYADIGLEKGNLIIVPRANPYSIKKNNRGVFGDMNRKFTVNESPKDDYDSRKIEILKNLISQSNVLLNLHEGSGYYYPTYVSKMKNPMRYGQSIIVDALRYEHTDGSIFDLEGPAIRVIEEINRSIKDSNLFFHFNDHNTFSEDSKHKEQRRSATYYALSIFGIPAFGIETSKSIKSIETKVKFQTLAINAFMLEYGIIPENPSIYLPTPELDHLVVNIGDNPLPLAVKNGSTLKIPSGTTVHISSIVANYKRGLTVDLLGYGNTNDLHKVAVINRPTLIKVYKDAYVCGEVNIVITSEEVLQMSSPSRLKHIQINIDSKKFVVSEGDTLHIIRGDIIRIVDAWTTGRFQSDLRINFYGFVGNKQFNDANDRGYFIDTTKDLLKGYDIDGKGRIYRIDALKEKKVIGSIFIAIKEPEVQYLIVEHGDGIIHAITPGSVVNCNKTDSLNILSIISNVTVEPFINIFIAKGKDQWQELLLPEVLEMPLNANLHFRRRSLNLGSISFRITE